MGTEVGGRFKLETPLGRRGSRTYRARDLASGSFVALKLISPSIAQTSAGRDRFAAEAALARSLSHPGIVPFVDLAEDARLGPYVATELVEGDPAVEDAIPHSFTEACDLLVRVADSLAHLHDHGIVHGDLAADHLMLLPDPEIRVMLVDIGIAWRTFGAPRPELRPQRSALYLAPERIAGGSPSIAADVYALGVLGYYLLTGIHPFDGHEVTELLAAHLTEPAPRLVDALGEIVSPEIEALIARALAKDPADRHPSVAAFQTDLAIALSR